MEKNFDTRTLLDMATFISFETSLPKQETLLDTINRLISGVKEAIISPDNTPDEINAMFDALQDLTLKKYHTEIRIAQLKRVNDINKTRDRVSEEVIFLKQYEKTLKEINGES